MKNHLSYPSVLLPALLLLTASANQLVAQTYATMEKSKTSSGYAPVNGINMYYETYGEGNIPLVLIHGGGSTIESTFSVMLPLLAPHGKLIAVELQAHGRTSDRNAPESFQQDADDVAGLLNFLHIEKADIFGFSNGGSTALQLAIRHPKRVNRIVVAAGAFLREGFIPGFFEGLAKATLNDMPVPLREDYLKVAPDKSQLPVMFEKDRIRMVTFKDWPAEQLKSIKAPTLVMAGDRDVVTTEHMLKMSRLIPGAQLAILPGVHGELLGERGNEGGSQQPSATAILIREFLR